MFWRVFFAPKSPQLKIQEAYLVTLVLKLHRVFSSYGLIPAFVLEDQFHWPDRKRQFCPHLAIHSSPYLGDK